MREEELVIRYRIPSIPEDTAPKEMKLMKEAQRHFGQQVIGMVMEHMAQNGVELLEARKKDFVEIQLDRVRRGGNAGEISILVVSR